MEIMHFMLAYAKSCTQRVPLHSSLLDLHQLLPTVLLYWAAHQPGGVYDSQVHQAVQVSILALQYWRLKHQSSSTEQQQDDADAAAAGAALLPEAQKSGDMPSLHPSVLEEGLPLVLLLLTRLQQQPRAGGASLPVAGGAEFGAAQGSQQQRSRTAAHMPKPLPATVDSQVPGVELLYRMCACTPGETTAAACAATAAGAAAADVAPAATETSASRGHVNPAQQHCTSIVEVTEAFVRANAQEGICNSNTLLRLTTFFFEDAAESALRCLTALAAASGNEAQHHLLGLLRSLLKLSAMGQQRDFRAAPLCGEDCTAAVCHLMSCQAGLARTGGSSSSSSSSSRLPWLHLLGHCYLHWLAELQQLRAAADKRRAELVTDHCSSAGVPAAATAAACVSTQPGLPSTLQQQQQQHQQEENGEEVQTAAAASMEGLLPADFTHQISAVSHI